MPTPNGEARRQETRQRHREQQQDGESPGVHRVASEAWVAAIVAKGSSPPGHAGAQRGSRYSFERAECSPFPWPGAGGSLR